MRILYIAQHNQKNNDDEGAISHALFKQGHDVVLFNPSTFIGDRSTLEEVSPHDYDIVLFHKLPTDYAHYVCTKWAGVCWFFDPIRKGFLSNDDYVDLITPWLYRGFFTDGDYVSETNHTKVIELKQGFDAISTTARVTETYKEQDVLFIGTAGLPGYDKRTALLNKVVENYGESSVHSQYSIFKDDLTAWVRNTKIMLAMPPVTDNYWSNRVYLLGGRGACLMHPISEGLFREFGYNLGWYTDFESLKNNIEILLDHPDERLAMAKGVQEIVWDRHCYHHRVKELVEQL